MVQLLLVTITYNMDVGDSIIMSNCCWWQLLTTWMLVARLFTTWINFSVLTVSIFKMFTIKLVSISPLSTGWLSNWNDSKTWPVSVYLHQSPPLVLPFLNSPLESVLIVSTTTTSPGFLYWITSCGFENHKNVKIEFSMNEITKINFQNFVFDIFSKTLISLIKNLIIFYVNIHWHYFQKSLTAKSKPS